MDQNQIPPIVGPSNTADSAATTRVVSPALLTSLIIVIIIAIGFFGWNYMQNKKPVAAPVVSPIAVTPKITKSVTPTTTFKTETIPNSNANIATAPQPTTTVTIAKTAQAKPTLKSGWKEIQQELSFYHDSSPNGNSVKFSFYAKSNWDISGGNGTQSYHVSAQDGQDNFYFYIQFLTPESYELNKTKNPNDTFIKTPTGNYLEVSHDSVSSSADFSYLVSSIIFE